MSYRDDFWKIFENTGHIGAYLLYRSLEIEEKNECSISNSHQQLPVSTVNTANALS